MLMNIQFLGPLGALLYLACTWLCIRQIMPGATTETSEGLLKNPAKVLLSMALVLHSLAAITLINTENGYDFSFFHVAVIFSWVMVTVLAIGCMKRPLSNLFLFVLPIAAISLLTPSLSTTVTRNTDQISTGVALHILFSLVAFSLQTLAAIQAVLVLHLMRNLKKHHFNESLRHLPPLQSMEHFMFEIIFWGLLFLLLAIVSGFVFMEDMFAQHLAHKTILSISSALFFSLLLLGRKFWGWRGRKAQRWVWSAYGFLILAYFGSKFVLEILLNRF